MVSFMLTLLPFLLSLTAAAPPPAEAVPATCGLPCLTKQGLGNKLSKGASFGQFSSIAPRWSEYAAPNPGIVVDVATEKDVQKVVQFCAKNNIPFLAQAGGSGWANTFTLGQGGVLINLRGIRDILFNDDKTAVTFQGGTIISELITAAYYNNTQVSTGNCNCIGVLGAALGGGYGRLMGLYGMMVDELLSMNVVTATGDAITITPADTDLWWAMRGAGANFGIVTSATMRAHPVPQEENGAWLGPLIFTPDKIEALVAAIDALPLTDRMSIFMYYTTDDLHTPIIITIPFYLGPEAEGRKAFASIFAVGPVVQQTTWTPYNRVNRGSDSFCEPGGRKPSFAAGLRKLEPTTWKAVWERYVQFLQQNPGAKGTTVLMEYYPTRRIAEIGDNSSSYAWRSEIRFNAIANTQYEDPALDKVANAFGNEIRNAWRKTGGVEDDGTYINYANGDETLQAIYGNGTDRLLQLKQKYDPQGRFNQWFPLVAQPSTPATTA